MPPANAGEKDFDRVEKYLLKELETLGEVEKLLAQDRADYLATRSELEQEVSELSAGIRFSRLQVSAWMQAHEALANGVKDPGKWLSAALGVAGSARHVL